MENKYTYPISIKVTPEMNDAIVRRAHDQGINKGIVVRKAIVFYLKAKKILQENKKYL